MSTWQYVILFIFSFGLAFGFGKFTRWWGHWRMARKDEYEDEDE